MIPGTHVEFPSAAARLPAPAANVLLAGFAREGVIVVIGNALIAAALTAVGIGKSFFGNLVFSEAIGLSIMLLLDLGRFHLQRRNALTGPRLAVAMVLAIVLGAALGRGVASLLLGLDLRKAFATKDLALTGWIALTATLLVTWYGWSRTRIAELSEQVARAAWQREAAERTALGARLQALQAQIEPHFLFNTLATLDSLIASDPPRARTLLASLNRFLRATLEASRAQSETLAAQFKVLDAMLAVHAMRLGPRLAYALDLPRDCADLPVPPMLLQPLVENALKHGIQGAVEGGRIDVSARRDAQHLELSVADTGSGFGTTPGTQGAGVGLANVRERLTALYGDRASLTLIENVPHGLVARVRLPLPDAAGANTNGAAP
ncbi:sensor histidine kinase [Paraburkholderia lycopersici]|uniref:Histidine kinase-, DNA gyrase B-, and HSP90-like ATPase n=1 Tax=Paraburkholderia lycopersici TaxID=416944 RepID=A0A1G6M6K2_9BURK|nr:histidine kinase [Paraburkholderia lycopersici]SDC51110.1 Histidine kinase-, DNA gyrase B-, and HSP90-like ATPase [Paraburkholderia lycopersici]